MKRAGFKPFSKPSPSKPKLVISKSKAPIKQRSSKRANQEKDYRDAIPAFLRDYPVCPVNGGRSVAIHHSARRRGGWLGLKRYWIAVSNDGHKWIEENGKAAEARGLMVRINQTYKEHLAELLAAGIDPDEPLYYSR